jgi:ubiquinone/menaquinone biosynthesis C-methylase UbiE
MLAAYKNITIAGGDTAKPLAMAKRLKVIKQYLTSDAKLFLDCGCGAGDYVIPLIEQFGLDAHGVEYSEQKVAQAQSNVLLKNRIKQGNLQAIESPANAWDYAMLNEVLEHIPDERQALKEIHRILKPDGILFIFSPNRWFPFETHGVNLKKNGDKVPHWLPFIPYLPLRWGQSIFNYWARNYWQKELVDLAKSGGFQVIGQTFVWLTFENISGSQPRLIDFLKPFLRFSSNTFEKTPFFRRFGVSQVLICRKK